MNAWGVANLNSDRKRQLVPLVEARDGKRCFYCGDPLGEDRTLEHLLSLADGGTHHVNNLVLAHLKCNERAGDGPVMKKILLRENMRETRKRLRAPKTNNPVACDSEEVHPETMNGPPGSESRS